MPCRDPTNRDQPRRVTAFGRPGDRVLETGVNFAAPEAAAAIQEQGCSLLQPLIGQRTV